MNAYVEEVYALDAPRLYMQKYCDYFEIGEEAPGFTLNAVVKDKQKEVSLSDYKGKWLVLFFYASDFTFV
jgi:hypothetical protein